MDAKARKNRKVKIAKLILNHVKGTEWFSVYDVQSWWIDEKMKYCPSIHELSRDLPAMNLDHILPTNWGEPWKYKVKYDEEGKAIAPYVYTEIKRN
ncbi:MAG: hypothetical protein WCS21_10875 [Lachnospiraceae bacterium]